MKLSQNQKGFTLLELILVIGVIAILAGIVFTAINPMKIFKGANDTKRKADVDSILSAVYEYTIDNMGTLPSGITTGSLEICQTSGVGCGSGMLDLSILTNNEEYLTAFPEDPTGATISGTGYTILKTGNGRITVNAPHAQGDDAISKTQ